MPGLVKSLLVGLGLSCALHIIGPAQSASTPGPKAKANNRNPDNQNCTNHLDVIDRCSSMATYSYTTQSNPYPITALEMRNSCDRVTEGVKCLKVYGKCLSSVSRRTLTSYTNARSKHSKRLCLNLNDSKTIDFWKSAECLRNSKKREIMSASEKVLISTIKTLAENDKLKWDDRFHRACCAADTYKHKVMQDMNPECTKYKQAMEDFVNSMVGELLDSVCPDENRLNDICSKLGPNSLGNNWKAGSLSGAALELIVALSDNPKTK